jgi:hypothetical protein
MQEEMEQLAMKTYLIGYDLNKVGQDYSTLESKIKSLGGWWHHLGSTWLVKSSSTAVAIRDALMKCMDGNDELLVIDVTSREAAWFGFAESGSNWLKQNL